MDCGGRAGKQEVARVTRLTSDAVRARRGFSLIEIMLAVAILAGLGVGLMSMLSGNSQVGARATEMQMATIMGARVMDRMVALGYSRLKRREEKDPTGTVDLSQLGGRPRFGRGGRGGRGGAPGGGPPDGPPDGPPGGGPDGPPGGGPDGPGFGGGGGPDSAGGPEGPWGRGGRRGGRGGRDGGGLDPLKTPDAETLEVDGFRYSGTYSLAEGDPQNPGLIKVSLDLTWQRFGVNAPKTPGELHLLRYVGDPLAAMNTDAPLPGAP